VSRLQLSTATWFRLFGDRERSTPAPDEVATLLTATLHRLSATGKVDLVMAPRRAFLWRTAPAALVERRLVAVPPPGLDGLMLDGLHSAHPRFAAEVFTRTGARLKGALGGGVQRLVEQEAVDAGLARREGRTLVWDTERIAALAEEFRPLREEWEEFRTTRPELHAAILADAVQAQKWEGIG
jgi:hypothetical protein